MIRRLLVVFVAALSAWLVLANPGAALGAPATPVQTYTYDVHLHPAAMTTATSERGPPGSTAGRVPTYNSVGLWSNGPSARPSGSATAAIYDYGDVRRLVQSDSITWTHGGEATGALSSLLLTGVAAKTAPEIKAGWMGGQTAGKRFPQSVKDETLAGNPGTCVYCRMETNRPQVDHSIPMSRGGNATLDNAQTTCWWCNASKGARNFPVNPPPGFREFWPPGWW
jgi:hypothetical protein